MLLATGDRDALQLVDENVTVLLAATKGGQPDTTAYTPEKIMEKYGMPPRRLIDLKALMGDASDNIPGVAGVGEKTALELLHRFSSLHWIPPICVPHCDKSWKTAKSRHMKAIPSARSVSPHRSKPIWHGMRSHRWIAAH